MLGSILEWLRWLLRWMRLLGPSRVESDISVPDSIRLTKLGHDVYGVCEPPESRRPSLDIVFFPGLQPEFSNRPEVTAWLSRDKSELWLSWLREENPDIRILVVSPNVFMEMEASGYPIDFKRMKRIGKGMTMELIGENVLLELTTRRIHVGKDGCPVILVGHGVGGSLAKEVCLQAHRMKSLHSQHEIENVRNFLDNVKGFLFYVPSYFDHRPVTDKATVQRDSDFGLLRQKRKWAVAALGANYEVAEGKFKGLYIPEASCRRDVDFFHAVKDDYFSICRPESIESEGYQHLLHFIARLTGLNHECQVSGTSGKVFLCGNQGVGKTTLRTTLSQPSHSLHTSEGSGRQQLPRTRGIEVSYVEIEGISGARPLTLALWDLAGQDDYAVLHSAFLPDLYNGPANFFVIVCNANDSQSNDLPSALSHVLYWLKFISSNTLQNVPKEKRRRVFVVLNCFHGDTSNHELDLWEMILAKLQEKFKNHLDLLEMPFILDATSSTAVTPLKIKLAKEAREMLHRSPMPEVCFTIQELCKNWARDHVEYPVLDWEEYCRYVNPRLNPRLNRDLEEWARDHVEYPVLDWKEYCRYVNPDLNPRLNRDLEESSRLLEQATEYLHGAGHLILLKHPQASSTSDHVVHKDLVILDPTWFCQTVVGYVLLPKGMVQYGEKTLRVYMEDDGSLPILTLCKSDLGQHIPEGKCEEAFYLLSRLGLCYTLDSRDRFFVPALIEDNDSGSSSSWFSKGDLEAPQQAWVMGFSLVLKDSSTTLLPIAPFRRLQVDLAERSDIRGRPDCEYRAWKSCITFKFEGMDVLVQYIGHDPTTSTQNRLDVLIKPLTHESDELSLQKKRQIELAQEIVDMFLNITNTSLPGVELERRVIRPWSVLDPCIDAPARDINISVEELVRILQDYKKLNWAVKGVQVTGEELLPEKDLQPVLFLRYQKCAIGVSILEWTRKLEDVQDLCQNEQQVVTYASSDHLDMLAANLPKDTNATQQRERVQQAATSNVNNPVNSGMVEEKSQPKKDLVDKDCSDNRLFREEVLSSLEQILQGLSVGQEQIISRIIQELHVVQTKTSDEIKRNTETLMIRIQNVETFPVEKGERIVPRLPYVKKTVKGKTTWITDFKILENVENPFQKAYKLHFLCEAPHDGNGSCHEVEGQVGLDLKFLKKWVKKIIPVLQFTLPIIVFGLKVVANVVVPGLQQAIPAIPTHFLAPFTPELQALAEVAKNFSQGIDHFDSQQGFSIQDYKQLRGEARAAVKELLDDARKKGVYQEQVGLFRVWLTRGGDPGGRRMVYICKKCLEKYTPTEAHQID